MQITPYLFFKGTCREAMTRYAEILGVDAPEILPFAGLPEADKAHMPGVPDDAVMHASLKVGSGLLMGSDDMGPDFTPMAGSSVNVTLPTAEDATRVFEALSAGGEVRMPLMEMFWTPAFGTLTDKWGIRWMVMAEGPQG